MGLCPPMRRTRCGRTLGLERATTVLGSQCHLVGCLLLTAVDSTTTLPTTSASTAKRCPETLPPLSLRRNFSWTLLGNVVYAGCQWGVIVVLAKLGSPEMVGQFALAAAIVTPVIMFANLGLRAVLATDVAGEARFRYYLELRLVTNGLTLAVITGLVLLAGYRAEVIWIVILMAMTRMFDSVSDILYGLFQRQERMDRIARSMVVKASFALGFAAIGVYLTGAVLGAIAGMMAANALTLFGNDIPDVLRIYARGTRRPLLRNAGHAVLLKPQWQAKMLGSLAWRSLPMGFAVFLLSLNTNIPRYFVEARLGERGLGVFASMAYITVVSSMLVCAIGQSASPRLASYFANRRLDEFRSLMLKLIGIITFIGVAAIGVALVAGGELLTVLYGEEYASQADVLVWLMVAQIFGLWGSILGCAITATRQFRRFTVPYLMTTVVATASSVFLIPTFGLLGAAWTACLVALTLCIASLAIMKKIWRTL
jgi:O-antigen/teichoic acid export membrane protein